MADGESSLFIPTIGLVVATAGLVVVTIYYAIQTRNTVKEMKNATESQFLTSVFLKDQVICSFIFEI